MRVRFMLDAETTLIELDMDVIPRAGDDVGIGASWYRVRRLNWIMEEDTPVYVDLEMDEL